MVSERTACDRLVRRLVSYGEPKGVCGRLKIGLFLLRGVYEEYLSGKATRELPVPVPIDGHDDEHYQRHEALHDLIGMHRQ